MLEGEPRRESAGRSGARPSTTGGRRRPAPAPVRLGRPSPERPRPRSRRPGVQRVDQAELLDRGQRGAVAELDRAGAEPDRGGGGGGQREHHRGGGAGDAGVEVVLGEPVAGVAEALGLLGEVDAVAQRLGGGGAGGDRHEVEDGERGGGHGAPFLASRRAAAAPWRPQAHGGSGISRRSTGAMSDWNSSSDVPVLGVGQAAGVRVQVQHAVPELLVVAVHLVDDLLRAADQRGAALDEVLQGRRRPAAGRACCWNASWPSKTGR